MGITKERLLNEYEIGTILKYKNSVETIGQILGLKLDKELYQVGDTVVDIKDVEKNGFYRYDSNKKYPVYYIVTSVINKNNGLAAAISLYSCI